MTDAVQLAFAANAPILAMSDTALVAIIGIFGAFVVAITPPIVGILWSISKQIAGLREQTSQLQQQADRVEKQTNGNLSDEKAKVAKAEQRMPGISQDHPPGTVIESRMSVNDPNTPDPPKVIENKVTEPPKPILEKP